MVIPDMLERHLLEGTSNIVLWKCGLQNLLKATKLWYLMKKEVKPTTYPKDLAEYKQECSECEASPTIFDEGSSNPSFCRQEHYQEDV